MQRFGPVLDIAFFAQIMADPRPTIEVVHLTTEAGVSFYTLLSTTEIVRLPRYPPPQVCPAASLQRGGLDPRTVIADPW